MLIVVDCDERQIYFVSCAHSTTSTLQTQLTLQRCWLPAMCVQFKHISNQSSMSAASAAAKKVSNCILYIGLRSANFTVNEILHFN